MSESRLAWHWAVAGKMHLSAILFHLVSDAHSGWKSPWREAFTAYSARQAGASCFEFVILDTALIKSCFFCIKPCGLRACSWSTILINSVFASSLCEV